MLRDRALIPLSQQHHSGLALCVLTDRSLEGEVSPETVVRIAARAVGRYDLEIANHFAVEEEVLFPVVEQELGEYPLAAEIVAEHRQLEQIIDQLRVTPTAGSLRQFSAVLRRHIRREEDELFKDIQQRLPRKVLDALGAAIDSRAVRIPI